MSPCLQHDALLPCDMERFTILTVIGAGSTVQNNTLTYGSFGNVTSSVSNPSDAIVREKQS